jgi:phospholipid/cholesterol/gamma-HCH transport system substrate-binding protein
MIEWTRGTEIRVGLFVAIGIVLFVITLLVIGAERSQFENRVHYKVALTNANGIGRGTQVRMAGLGIGQVEDTLFPDDLSRKRVVVYFWVRGDSVSRIRRDSRVKIGTKGMLGDKQLEITPGSSTEPPLPQWSFIPPAGDAAGNIMEVAEAAMQDVHETIVRVQKAVEPLTDPAFAHDLRAMASDLRAVTKAVNEGEGVAHKLLYDRTTAQKLDKTLDALSMMARDVHTTAATVNRITNEVEHGDGTAHALVYGTEGRDALVGLAAASTQIAALTRDIREGDGLLHSIIYTQEQRNLVVNLTEASAGIRQIVADLRAGRGTVGALLADPSVYEDLKRVIGNVGRSQVLRALVRYAITEDNDPPPPTRVRTPASGAASNGTAP